MCIYIYIYIAFVFHFLLWGGAGKGGIGKSTCHFKLLELCIGLIGGGSLRFMRLALAYKIVTLIRGVCDVYWGS